MFEETLQLIRSGVGHKVLVRRFFVCRQIQPTVLNITEDTLFDLASLSKLVATTMVALKFIENGR